MAYKISEDTMERFKREQKKSQKEYEKAVSDGHGYLEAYWKGKLNQMEYVLGMVEIENSRKTGGQEK